MMVLRLASCARGALPSSSMRVTMVGAAKNDTLAYCSIISNMSAGVNEVAGVITLCDALATCASAYRPDPCDSGAAWTMVSRSSSGSMSA